MGVQQAGNILSGGLRELSEIKNKLVELENGKKKCIELSEKEKQLTRQIQTMEKQLAERIDSVTKARRSELQGTYDEQLLKLKSRVKNVQTRKGKQKNNRISERIEEETAELREEKEQYLDDMAQLYRGEKLPGWLNNRYFHAITQPLTVTDFIAILLTLLFSLFIIPCGVYYSFFRPKTILLAACYVVCVVFFGGGYLLLRFRVREKHQEMFGQIRELRKKLVRVGRDMRKIARQIHKDRDESVYGLEEFDKELSELDEEIRTIENEKKRALKEYENNTRKEIAAELKAEVKEELETLRKEQDETYRAQRQKEEKVKNLSVLVSERYTIYLGKENMDVVLLDQLEEIMRAGEAFTIGEALNVQKIKEKQTRSNEKM